MSWTEALFLHALVLIGCLIGGVNIGAAMGIAGLVVITITSGVNLWPTLGDLVWNTTTDFNLAAVPLFILMSELVLQSGIASRFYTGIAPWFRRVPGGLAQTNIAGCAVFSAVAGSSVATSLTIGSVAIQEMRARGYSDSLTLGTLTAGGGLGILIPPSIPLLVYGSMTQESVIDLFAAGMIPGILLAVFFSIYVGILATVRPSLTPRRDSFDNTGSNVLRDSVPIILLIGGVIGGMYAGIVTPTEASGLGALFAAVIAAAYRQLNWRAVKQALRNTLLTSAVIMFITVCAQILNYSVITSGIGRGVTEWLVGLSLDPFLFFCLLILIYLIIGIFIDGLSIMLLTVPVLYVPLTAMGYNGVWLGIIMVIFIELGLLSPPVGMNLFAVQSIAPGSTLADVSWSSLPYCLIMIGFALLLYVFPQIVLWLPAVLK